IDRALAGGLHAASSRCASRRRGRWRTAIGPQCGGILSRPHYSGALPVSETRVNMEAEWQKSPDAVRRQLNALEAPLSELLRCLRREPPNFVLTSARGSSAHSATFGKHLIERHLGIPVGAFAPNVATIYKQRLKLNG